MSSTDSGLVVTRKQMGSIPILSCKGEIWLINEELFRAHLADVISEGVEEFGIDLSKVRYIGSSFFHSVMEVKKGHPEVQIVCKTREHHNKLFKLLKANRFIATTREFSFS